VVFGPKRSSHVSDIYEHARALVADPDRPTAFICHSPHATGLMEVFNEAGLQSPRDYSIIANGSAELTESGIGPGRIKTAMIQLPSRLTAQYATACLLEKLDVRSEEYPTWEAKVPCNLVEGPTIGPAPSR